MVTLLTLAAALTTAHAQTAADWTINGAVLLTGADVPWGNSVGAPSVVYDSHSDRYVMFFESFIGPTSNCPAGEWGIGTAFSTDGKTFTVRPTAQVAPDPASATPNYYSCVAAHPGAIYLPPTAVAPGGTVFVYFKAEQASDACTVLPSPPSWGCEQYTGVGVTRIRLRANGSVKETLVSAEPVLPKSTNFGYPKPIRYNGTAVLSYTEYPNVKLALASSPLGPFIEQGTALDVNDYTVTWMEDEFYNAALACRDSGNFPLEIFAGGRDTNFGIVIDGGIGKAVASPAAPTTWTLATSPQFTFVGDDSFRHWDILRVAASDYLMYYSEKDGSGNNQIRLATTLPSFTWTNTDVYDKACP